MPVPSKERVFELLSDLVHRQGYDLEGVSVTQAGKHSVVRVVVDSDAGLELDAVAELSRIVSEAFDAAPEFGETPYTLEVTSPGIDRPLTEPRHWRRARGRKVLVEIGDEKVTGRVGALGEGVVSLVVPGKGGPTVREIALGDVVKAVVQVEFSPPNAKELELAGGVAEGRVVPTEIGDDTEIGEDADDDGTDEPGANETDEEFQVEG
ncbi:ribosome maturation factor RimP [Rhodococcus spelaei]|uniref:Ribosome maturation factor RimP n=1 Tax=Rhodococcus spelaei TaxID=2546320 RepID=A0A541B3X0_9NOCA|nr:ribosome maturation factor RimP [Rhodococcus spelaei]TQF66996.1 ribosome maturation factor RimP [Rhodococcus spelaei]